MPSTDTDGWRGFDYSSGGGSTVSASIVGGCYD
jgi:hypothetical protein